MQKRKDGRYRKKKVINGKAVYFYSSESTERKAQIDIENQMIKYKEKAFVESHNFKILADKALEHQSKKIEYKTIETYTCALKHLEPFYDLNIEDITPLMLESLLNDMSGEEYSFSSISKTKTTFGLVLNYAMVKEGLNITNFMKSVKIPKTVRKKKIKSPKDEVIDSIIKNVYTTNLGFWYLSILCTGLRRGELNAIQVQDIDFENKKIPVEKVTVFEVNQPVIKYFPKSEDGIREVPILDMYMPYLEEACKNLKPTDYLFGGENPLTKSAIRRRSEQYQKATGLNFTNHQLRHAYAKLLYKAGIDPKTMQKLLGHADFSTTMNIYTEFANEVTNASIEKLNNYINEAF